jgi:hypothetical protein
MAISPSKSKLVCRNRPRREINDLESTVVGEGGKYVRWQPDERKTLTAREQVYVDLYGTRSCLHN